MSRLSLTRGILSTTRIADRALLSVNGRIIRRVSNELCR